MKTPNFKGIINMIQTTTIKYNAEILTGIGIAGMITTSFLVGKGTIKAVRLLDEKKESLEPNEKLPPLEIIKTTGTCYIPAIITGGLSIACLIGSSSINMRRNTALATAYKLSETAFTEYREKVVENIGRKKEEDIKSQISQDKINNNPVTNKEVFIAGGGDTLCYDEVASRYFESDMETLKRAFNNLNRRMMTENYISLNDLYDEIGLRNSTMGDDLGWNMSWGFIEPSFSTQLADNGKPCLVMGYRLQPRSGYDRLL